MVTGTQTDILISPYLDFHFWEEVFVEVPRGGEQWAHWCSPSNSHKQEDFLTYHVLLDDSKQLVTSSNVHTTKDPLFPNCKQCPTLADGDTSVPVSKPVVMTIQDYYDDPMNLPVFHQTSYWG